MDDSDVRRGRTGGPEPEVSRRMVFRGGMAVTAGLAVGPALAGCANSGTADDPASDAPPGAIIPVEEVPVGGVASVTIDRTPAFVARPDEDTVRAFSAVCTHQGCTVRARDDVLACPCHGSQFELLTGAVVRGPATEPLPPIDVHLGDGDVIAGS